MVPIRDLQGHDHVLNAGSNVHLLRNDHPNGVYELFSADVASCAGCSAGYYDVYNIISPTIGAPDTLGSNGTPRIANETRPDNMTVVWIIRIK